MLIEFSVGNYLSFKDVVTLSMVASSIKELDDTHTFKTSKNLRLLKSAIVYGANASGKSNLFKAMTFMSDFVYNSSKESQVGENIEIEKFRLSTETESKPSYFEIVFLYDNVKYRYGFKVDTKRVRHEWLFYAPKKQEIKLFERIKNHFDIREHFKEGNNLEQKTRDNALFLSVVAQFNGEKSTKVLKWFRRFNNISGLSDQYQDVTTKMLENDKFKNIFIKLIKIADSGIEDITINKDRPPFDKLPKQVQQDIKIFKEILGDRFSFDDTLTNVVTSHKKFDSNNKFKSLELFELGHESHGTIKLFSLLGPILDTLAQGKVLAIDEFDSRLHTLLSRFIVWLFNSNNKNLNNAQIIVNTHDTNLLSNKIFRRDQIWFTEKNRYGSTNLYSLVEYSKVRKDASYEKNYLLGKYGAIPFIEDFQYSVGEE